MKDEKNVQCNNKVNIGGGVKILLYNPMCVEEPGNTPKDSNLHKLSSRDK